MEWRGRADRTGRVPSRPLAVAALLVAALSLGASWSHILQIRGKLGWDAGLWRTVMESLYRDYATLGAITEIGAIVLAWALVLACRRMPGARLWAIAGAVLFSLAFFGLWLGLIAPINKVFAGWSPDAMPPDWRDYRDQWELWHAVIAAVKALGFGALAWGTLTAARAAATR